MASSRVALVLGSGGARGYAHIGVLQVLAERGIEVATIAGTSMGALVGGMYAAGRLEEFTDWGLALRKQLDVVRLMDPSFGSPGMIRANRIQARISELLDGVRIEELPIPYTAVATELWARREVWFQQGLLATAIRASIAIPSVITPVMIGGRLLVDGGVTNPVPIEPTPSAAVDYTIAVTLAGPSERERPAQRNTPVHASAAEHDETDAWLARVRKGAAELLESRRRASARPEAEHPNEPDPLTLEPLPRELSLADLVSGSLDTMGAMITRYRLAGNPPDVLINVPIDSCRTLDFHRAEPMIELGRRLAIEALDARSGPAGDTGGTGPVTA